jgi:hypothetical protein
VTINSLLSQIEEGSIVLPAIQREFVWEREQITRLLDSILRSYPVGIALLWETYEDIQFRRFEHDYQPAKPAVFKDNPGKKKLRLVLDGQQRLQSLYLAIKGTYEGQILYLDILSGKKQDDVSAERFWFYFGAKEDGDKWNQEVLDHLALPPDQRPRDFAICHYVRVADLLSMKAKARKEMIRKIRGPLALSEDDELRAELNFDAFDRALAIDQNILRTAIVDEDLPSDHEDRKDLADVLEMFVRVNSGGTPLDNAELIFSMLKLGWKESAEALPEFVREINNGRSMDLDAGFVIRCLLAVSNLSARFDLNVLRKKSNVQKLKENFARCCEAIRATLDFITRDCLCSSVELLGSRNVLVIFVYYFFHLPKHTIAPSDLAAARRALFLFAFARPLSRWGESRLNKFLSWELKGAAESGNRAFPLQKAIYWISEWAGFDALDEHLVQNNLKLAMHLVQGLANTKVSYHRNAPEVDHIFPAAGLRQRKVNESLINDFGNYWILPELRNKTKSDADPADYFSAISDAELKRALIPREQLDYARFEAFVAQRRQAIVRKVAEQLDLPVGKFAVA